MKLGTVPPGHGRHAVVVSTIYGKVCDLGNALLGAFGLGTSVIAFLNAGKSLMPRWLAVSNNSLTS